MTCCAATRCNDRVPLPDGGWACRTAVERGLLQDPQPVQPAATVTEPASPPRRREHGSVAAIEARCCPCCAAGLGSSDWPSWLVCERCRCHWKLDLGRDGIRRACRVRGAMCAEE